MAEKGPPVPSSLTDWFITFRPTTELAVGGAGGDREHQAATAFIRAQRQLLAGCRAGPRPARTIWRTRLDRLSSVCSRTLPGWLNIRFLLPGQRAASAQLNFVGCLAPASTPMALRPGPLRLMGPAHDNVFEQTRRSFNDRGLANAAAR